MMKLGTLTIFCNFNILFFQSCLYSTMFICIVLEVYLNQISFPVLENVKDVPLRIFSGSGTDIPLSVMVMSMNGSAIGM